MRIKNIKSAIAHIRLLADNGAVDSGAIKRRRKVRGLTQAEAAKLAEMSVQWWSDLENGKHENPRVLTLARVAAVLGCKVDDLLRK